MYHPAKIEDVVEAGGRPVCVVETWDKNLFTVDVADGVDTDRIAPDRIVLLDYSADDRFEVPTPRQEVAAVLSDEQGEQIWDRYKSVFQETQEQQTAMMQMPANQPFDGGYIG